MTEQLHLVRVRASGQSLTLRDLAAVFFRQRRLLTYSFLVVLLAGILYALLAPSYKAEMKVLVRRGRIDPVVTPTETAPPVFDHQEVTEEDLNSEVELLRDEDILREVVLNTGLAKRASILPWLSTQGTEEDIQRAIRRLARKLDVQPVRKSHLITVTYASSNGPLAAAVLKSLSDAYLAKHAEIRRPTGQQPFFEQQMRQSRSALEETETRLTEFNRGKKVASAALERDLALQKLSDAQSSDFALQAAIAETAERVRSLQTKILELPQRRVSQTRNADNPQLMEKLKSKLLELQLKRTELLTKFQPSYRLVQEINQQIEQATSAIEEENLKPLRDELMEPNPEYEWASSERTKALVELQALLKRHAVTHAQVSEYRQTAQELGETVVAQNDLEGELKAAQDKYLLYSSKREEARIGDALDENGILNVTLAETPRVPVLPAWPLWASMCMSVAAASVFSTGVAFGSDYLDPRVRTPDEAFDLLGLPVLASIPTGIVRPPELRGL